MFEVSTITQRRKSTTRPCRSVRRPSSNTCRKRSQIGWAAFSNSSSRTTANGSLRTEETSAAPRCSCVVSERSRSSDSGVWYSLMSRRTSRSAEPEEELGERLRDLGLARARSARRRGRRRGARGIRDAGLDHRDPLDDAVHGLGLLEHAALEERAHLRERERGLRIEQGEREAGPRRERREHVGAGEALGALLGRLGSRRGEEPEQVPGRRDPGQELLGQLERLGERLVVGRDLERVLLEGVPRDRDRVRLVERAHAHDLERARDPRPRATRSSSAVGVASARSVIAPDSTCGSSASSSPCGLRMCWPAKSVSWSSGSTQTTSCPATDSTSVFTRPSSSPM